MYLLPQQKPFDKFAFFYTIFAILGNMMYNK